MLNKYLQNAIIKSVEQAGGEILGDPPSAGVAGLELKSCNTYTSVVSPCTINASPKWKDTEALSEVIRGIRL